IEQQTKGLFDETHVDAMGSLHGVIHARPSGTPGKGKKKGAKGAGSRGKRPTRVMIAAHMDQIGFMVRHVDGKGFAWLSAVGGFDTRNLFARVVNVAPDVNDPKKDLRGVLNPGGRPVHIATPEDRKKVPEVGEFFVDFGLPADEVKERVTVGSMVTLIAPLHEVGGTVVSQCLDNRVACWELIEALRKLKKHACEVHAVFTVQEEVGLRGAGPATFVAEPDLALALDTTLCCDTPGVPENDSVTKQGEGVGINVADGAAIVDLDLLNDIEAVAKKKKIKHQRTILHRGGTDAGTIQRAGRGHRVVTLLTPTRYIHTVTETIHKDDMHAARDLVAAYLESVK
ncbi:MAG: M20/M25/M40 family metallo-hydrolase, partial [Planctomycetota bacterium]